VRPDVVNTGPWELESDAQERFASIARFAAAFVIVAWRVGGLGSSVETMTIEAVLAGALACAWWSLPADAGADAALASSLAVLAAHAPHVLIPLLADAFVSSVGAAFQCGFCRGRSGGRAKPEAHEADGDQEAATPASLALSPGPLTGEALRSVMATGAASMVSGILRSAVAWKAFDHSVCSGLRVTRVSLSRAAAMDAAVALRGASRDSASARRLVASVDGADDDLVAAAEGGERFAEVEAELLVEGEHCNVFGALHGGCVMTLVDDVTTLAQLALDCTRPGVTVDLSASIARPVMRGETIRVVARVLSLGKRLCFTEADILKSDGRVAAFGRHTKAV